MVQWLDLFGLGSLPISDLPKYRQKLNIQGDNIKEEISKEILPVHRTDMQISINWTNKTNSSVCSFSSQGEKYAETFSKQRLYIRIKLHAHWLQIAVTLCKCYYYVIIMEALELKCMLFASWFFSIYTSTGFEPNQL